MVNKKVTITNLSGLHMGAAGKFCDEAIKYTDTSIKFIYKDNYEANAKSMLSVLGASVQAGQDIEIICDGPQEEEALLSLVELVESNFDEF